MTPSYRRGDLSGLTDLPSWLTRIREIATLPDAEALQQLDALLWGAFEIAGAGPEAERDWDEALVQEQIQRVRSISERLRDTLQRRPQDLTLQDLDQLQRETGQIGFNVSREHVQKHAQAIAAAKAEAREVATQVELVYLTARIRDAGSLLIATAAAVLKVYGTVNRALEALQRSGQLTPGLEAEGRAAKERAARFRAQKKLDEAEVSEAGGNAKKATRLRAEAGVVWAQDFAKAFPGAPVATLDEHRS